jgi:tRNA nucleotidyltransferase (CCA-adding enzyme)
MNDVTNLSEMMKARLSDESQEILTISVRAAAGMDANLYLVGGIVRDLLLGRKSYDLDLVVEGDAIALAARFADITGGKITVHSRFRTATVKWQGRSIDFVTARSETYPKPGALPVVKPGKLNTDLARRDFTINAMAVILSPEQYGNIIDPFNGQVDLTKKRIRILHDRSFIDDATRIWRAIRYEQRLDFTIEPGTFSLLEQHRSMLATISRDRIRHELELVLKEDKPEKALRRATELGVLEDIHPELKADEWLSRKFTEARKTSSPEKPAVELYLTLLLYRLDSESMHQLSTDLNLRKQQTSAINGLRELKMNTDSLLNDSLGTGELYRLLNRYPAVSLTAVSIGEDNPRIRESIRLYSEELKHTRTILTGQDLQTMGVPSGPQIKKILTRLLIARLDGKVTSRKDEETLVKQITASR